MRLGSHLRTRPVRPPAPAPHGAVVASLTGVAVRRGPRTVVRDVDLQVRAGEVLAVVGPNGAGKSTILGVLSGDLPPAAGRVLLDGAPTGSWTAAELGMLRRVQPVRGDGQVQLRPLESSEQACRGRAGRSRHPPDRRTTPPRITQQLDLLRQQPTMRHLRPKSLDQRRMLT